MKSLAILLTLLCGCNGGSGSNDETGDSAAPMAADVAACPDTAQALTIELTALGYAIVDQGQNVFTDQAALDAYLQDASTSSGVTDDPSSTVPPVDFTTSVVFTNWWADGGCEEAPTYAACLEGDAIEAFYEPGLDDGCDAYFPIIDVLVVPRETATTFSWASP